MSFNLRRLTVFEPELEPPSRPDFRRSRCPLVLRESMPKGSGARALDPSGT